MAEERSLVTIIWDASQPLEITQQLIDKINSIDDNVRRISQSFRSLGTDLSIVNRQLDDTLAKVLAIRSVSSQGLLGSGASVGSYSGGYGGGYGSGYSSWQVLPNTPGSQVLLPPPYSSRMPGTMSYTGEGGGFVSGPGYSNSWGASPYGSPPGRGGPPGFPPGFNPMYGPWQPSGMGGGGGGGGGQGPMYGPWQMPGMGGGRGGDPAEPIERQSRALGILNNHFVRHLAFIAEGLVIYGSYRAAVAIVSDLTRHVLELETASARLAGVTGGGFGAAQQGVLGAGISGAPYGISAAQSGAGAVIAAQLGASQGQQELARQASQLFLQGGDSAASYKNILEEVVATQQQLNSVGEQSFSIQDTLARMYEISDQSVETYFDSIQSGIAIHDQLGISAERASIAILRMAQFSEGGVSGSAGLLTKLALLFQPESASRLAQLRPFGVTATGPGEGIPQIAQIAQEMIKSGDTDRATEYFRILSGGSLLARADMQKMALALYEFNRAMDEGGVVAGAWQEKLNTVLDTSAVKIQHLTASWDVFIQSMIAAQVVAGPLGDAIEFVANALDHLSKVEQYRGSGQSPEGRGPGGQGFDDFTKGIGIVEALIPFNTALIRRLVEDAVTGQGSGFGEFATPNDIEKQAIFGTHRNGRDNGPFPWSVPSGREQTGFGGVREMPEGFNRAEMQARIDMFTEILDKIPGREPVETERFAFIDVLTGKVQYLTGPVDALGLALNNTTDAVRRFGGFAEIPESIGGISGSKLQAAVNRQQRIIEGIQPGRQDYEQSEERIYHDPKTGRDIIIQGSAEANKRALDGLTKAFDDAASSFGGFRTLPEGVSFNQLQSRSNAWQQRIVGAQKGPQDYEQQQTFMIVDPLTRAMRPLVTSNEALRFATEELTKVQKQITGVFNVPVGGEAVVAFSALQAGFVPNGEQGSGGSGGPELKTAGTQLSGSAAALEQAAYAIERAARGLSIGGGRLAPLARLQEQALAGGVPDYDARGIGVGVSAMQQRNAQVAENALSRARSGLSLGGGRLAPYAGLGQQMPTSVSRPGNISVNIANRINVYLSGQLIAQQINRQNYSQLATTRRATSSVLG